jgi:DNA-binding CsgD family transcriptional regulator
MMLVGRDAECERIDRLLSQARHGTAGVLVLVGQAGVGKTELLRYAQSRGADMQVLRARGSETEAELSFAGLADLIRPLIGAISQIPAPQAAALAGALRLTSPPDGGDRFASYLATLSLLAQEADETPVLAIIDDVQWLDTATIEALAFVCRRLSAEPIAVLMSARDSQDALPVGLRDLPTTQLRGLDDDSAALVLDDACAETLTPAVRRRLVEVTAGNPLALREIPSVLSEQQRLGADPLPDPLPAGPSVRWAFGRRLGTLSDNARTALLVAAISNSNNLAEIDRALSLVGASVQDLIEAEAVGMVTIADGRLEFAHPLVRSTVYASADDQQRRHAHQLLADSLCDDDDLDRRAWHLAAACFGPDESVARQLENAALMARRRGGPVGAATALERSARLSPDRSSRVRRLREAAGDWVFAGVPKRAEALLDEAETLGPDPAERTHIVLLQSSLATYAGDTERAYGLLTAEAARAERDDPGGAALLLAKAVLPVLADGDVRLAATTAGQAQTIARSSSPFVSAQVNAIVLHTFILSGQGRSVASLIDRYEALLPTSEGLLRARFAACSLAASFIWTEQFDRARSGLGRVVAAARAAGAPAMLPYPLALTCDVSRRTGEWAAASAAGHEAVTLARELRQPGDLLPSLVCLARLEAVQGLEQDCRAHVSEALEIAGERGFRSMVTVARHALGSLALGRGELELAIPELEQAGQLTRDGGLEEPAVVEWAPDLVEAYVRCGRLEEADRLLVTFTSQAERSGQCGGLAAAARCRGLLASTSEYEKHFTVACELHERAEMPFELARSRLCLGERLRRDQRRVDARVPLRQAAKQFQQLGATPWTERTVLELRATGETVARDAQAPAALTPQELQVALTVASGATSREAANSLFLSPRTVDHHLGKIYQKLEVRSRTELVRMVITGAGPFASVQHDAVR